MSEYQKRTAGRLVEILRAQDENPRSWQREAADMIERLSSVVYLQGDAGWYAMHLVSPKFCVHRETLEEAEAMAARALSYVTARANQQSTAGSGN